MPRKKHQAVDAEPHTEEQATAPSSTADIARRPDYIDGPPTTATGEITPADAGAEAGSDPADGQGKNWGPPYKAIFTSPAKGFEMGENRRFKQRVFKFNEKPAPEIIEKLKDAGFVYRPEEKAWTIHADSASRVLSEELAAEFAGESRDLSR